MGPKGPLLVNVGSLAAEVFVELLQSDLRSTSQLDGSGRACSSARRDLCDARPQDAAGDALPVHLDCTPAGFPAQLASTISVCGYNIIGEGFA